MPAFIYRELAWAWIIIVGGGILTPGGFVCTRCGPLLTIGISVISVAIGTIGFMFGRGSSNRPGRPIG